MKSAIAFAPASVANFAVGFDLLGFALEGMGDTVRVTRIEEKTVRVRSIEIGEGLDRESFVELPKEPEKNTAAMGLLEFIREQKLEYGFEIEIKKGIPLGSGLGGSAASAAAALLAANAVLDRSLEKSALIKYAITGEAVASGARHGDNVIPSLLGGVLIVASEENTYARVALKGDWHVAVLYPGFRLDTRRAREVLPKTITLKAHTRAQTRLAMVLAGLAENDPEKVRQFLVDEIIEPARASLIPDFYEIKRAALDAGAIGGSISGAGPTVFALTQGRVQAERVLKSMGDAASTRYPKHLRMVSSISAEGARVLK